MLTRLAYAGDSTWALELEAAAILEEGVDIHSHNRHVIARYRSKLEVLV
jgi:hypothetical protein